MEEIVDQIIKGLQEELGPNWVVSSRKVFDVVHYFDCEFEGNHFLTHSYGIYKEVDTQKIIKKEAELIRRLL
jgi:hypothetical protein